MRNKNIYIQTIALVALSYFAIKSFNMLFLIIIPIFSNLYLKEGPRVAFIQLIIYHVLFSLIISFNVSIIYTLSYPMLGIFIASRITSCDNSSCFIMETSMFLFFVSVLINFYLSTVFNISLVDEFVKNIKISNQFINSFSTLSIKDIVSIIREYYVAIIFVQSLIYSIFIYFLVRGFGYDKRYSKDFSFKFFFIRGINFFTVLLFLSTIYLIKYYDSVNGDVFFVVSLIIIGSILSVQGLSSIYYYSMRFFKSGVVAKLITFISFIVLFPTAVILSTIGVVDAVFDLRKIGNYER